MMDRVNGDDYCCECAEVIRSGDDDEDEQSDAETAKLKDQVCR